MGSARAGRQRIPVLFVLGAVWVVSGCSIDSTFSRRNSQISWLDASATIRVEVEVYKGPLSKEPAVQVAELKGIVADSFRALRILDGNMDYSRRQMNCYVPSPCNEEAKQWRDCKLSLDCDKQMREEHQKKLNMCSKVRTITDKGVGNFKFAFTYKKGDKVSRNQTQACNSLRQLFHDVKWASDKYEEVKDSLSFDTEDRYPLAFVKKCGFGVPRHLGKNDQVDLDICEDRLRNVSNYGSRLKRRAAYWAAEHVATSPVIRRLRIEMANFAQFAAEYGNQITSRADALLKQAAGARVRRSCVRSSRTAPICVTASRLPI